MGPTVRQNKREVARKKEREEEIGRANKERWQVFWGLHEENHKTSKWCQQLLMFIRARYCDKCRMTNQKNNNELPTLSKRFNVANKW